MIEVHAEICAIVGEYHEGAEEYLNVMATHNGQASWPDGRVAVFAVRGTSEGHYIHVEVLDPDGNWPKRALLILGKTFAWDAAWAFAKRLGAILGV